jgi:thioredoxin 1
MSSNLIETGDADFSTLVLGAELPVLVDCWAPWCKPCIGMQPALEEFAVAYKGKVMVAKVNVDDNTETAKTYGVRSLPTMMLVDKGVVVAKRIGVLTGRQMTDWVEELIGREKLGETGPN